MSAEAWKESAMERLQQEGLDFLVACHREGQLSPSRASWVLGQAVRQFPLDQAVSALRLFPFEAMDTTARAFRPVVRQAIRRAARQGDEIGPLLEVVARASFDEEAALVLWKSFLHSLPSDAAVAEVSQALARRFPVISPLRWDAVARQVSMSSIWARVLHSTPGKEVRALARYGDPDLKAVHAVLVEAIGSSSGHVSAEGVRVLLGVAGLATSAAWLTQDKDSLLDLAARSQRWEVFTLLLDNLQASSISTEEQSWAIGKAARALLARAPSVAQFEVFFALTQAWPQWPSTSDSGGSALHALLQASPRKIDPALVERLLAAGSPIDGASAQGNTALHLVAGLITPTLLQRSQLGTVWEVLVSHGASEVRRNSSGKAPLELLGQRCEMAVVDMIRARGHEAALARAVGISPQTARSRL